VGPRLELEIVKVEEGLCDGRVLFHKYQQRSAAQAAEQQQDWDERAAVREERRKQQVGGRQKGWGVGTAESGSCKRLLLHAVPHCGSLADIAVSPAPFLLRYCVRAGGECAAQAGRAEAQAARG
jgi:hypothetical protein